MMDFVLIIDKIHDFVLDALMHRGLIGCFTCLIKQHTFCLVALLIFSISHSVFVTWPFVVKWLL